MKRYIKSSNHFPIDMNIIHTAEEDGYELSSSPQEYDSARTSINSKQLPAIYKMISFHPGDVVVDYGGGKFDNAVEYLKDKDVTLCVYDPYNRSSQHNSEVLKILKQNGGADAAVCSNVLNVIKEPEARKDVLKNISKITKSGAPVYITVYEGSGKGNEGPTKSGYQLNRKTEGYLQEIQEVFPDASRRGKLVVAHNKSITSARRSNNDFSAKLRQHVEKNLKDFFSANRHLETFDSSMSFEQLHHVSPTKYKGYEYNVSVFENPDSRFPDLEYVIEVTTDLTKNGEQKMCDYLNDRLENFQGYEGSIEPGGTQGPAEGYMNKIDVAANTSITAADQYDKRTQVNNLGTKYAIHYTSLPGLNTQNPSPEDDEKAFHNFKAQITVLSPYDDADYYWAKILGNGKIQYIYRGQVKDEGQYTGPDQEYESLTEWMDNVCSVAEEALYDYNMNIKKRIVNDSKKISSRKKSIKADVDLDSQDIMNEISSDVRNRLLITMVRQFGYSQREARDYSSVEVWKTTYGGENYYSVEVGAELDFDDLMDLADALNPEVEQWDRDAYFDAEDSGRLSAMINAEKARQEYINSCDQSSAIMSAYDDIPEPSLDPPEDYVWEDGFVQEELDIDLTDQYITVDENGDVIWEDEDFADTDSSDGWWYGYELYECQLDDGEGVLSNLTDVIYPQLPAVPGDYSLSGIVHLLYDVNYQYTTDPDAEGRYLDEHGDEFIEPESYEVSFNFSSSWAEGLTCAEV